MCSAEGLTTKLYIFCLISFPDPLFFGVLQELLAAEASKAGAVGEEL